MDPNFSSPTASPAVDHVRAGEFPALTEDVTIASGENLTEGAVLGKVTVGAVTGDPVAGNTGNGTIGTLSAGANAKPGVYIATCIEPAANAGKFSVEDPDGVNVGTATVAVAFAGPVNFTIADGATDFIAGDQFAITVAAGTGQYKRSVAAATDGSQRPLRILARDCDASGGAKEAPVYMTGEFAKNRLNFGAGHTATTVEAALRAENIYLRDVLAV
jgi:hypothetical protein